MSILLSRVSVVPTWFVVVGLVALSSPPIVPKGVLLLGAVVAASAVIITFALSATGHPGRHRAGWAYETAYEGALDRGPRCCEFMTSELIHPFAPRWSRHL